MIDLSELLVYTGSTPLELVIWPLFIGICIGAFLAVFIRVRLGALVRALIEKGAYSPDTAKTLAELGFNRNFFVKNALRTSSSFRKTVRAVNAEQTSFSEQTDISEQTKPSDTTESEPSENSNLSAKNDNLTATINQSATVLENNGESDADSPAFSAEELANVSTKLEKIDVDRCSFYIPAEALDRARTTYDNTGSTVAFAFLTMLVFLIVAGVSMMIIPTMLEMLDELINSFGK